MISLGVSFCYKPGYGELCNAAAEEGHGPSAPVCLKYFSYAAEVQGTTKIDTQPIKINSIGELLSHWQLS